jgi:phosphoribosyl 1,2-cyclic phosphodiesterase
VRARIWGCRGSLPAPAPDTVRYGGNTSCVELRVDDDTVIILDAGSGMRPLGRELAASGTRVIHVLLTHLHLDHLQGLAFFLPFWADDVELHIWGPPSPSRGLADRVAAYVSPPLFPIHLSDVPSRPVFHDVPDEPWMIGSALVAGYPVVHQGPAMGFRVTADERTLAYIPDHEPSLGVDLRKLEPDWISGYRVAEGADVLLHDAQYSDGEYGSHVGWGHSSIDHAVSFAQAARVDRLVLFHHDPAHSDAELEFLLEQAQSLWVGAQPPVLAAEGMVFDLGPHGVDIDSSTPTMAPQPLPLSE